MGEARKKWRRDPNFCCGEVPPELVPCQISHEKENEHLLIDHAHLFGRPWGCGWQRATQQDNRTHLRWPIPWWVATVQTQWGLRMCVKQLVKCAPCLQDKAGSTVACVHAASTHG